MNALTKLTGGFAVKCAVVALATFALVAVLSRNPGYFVGDSADYYSMFIAWKSTLRPFMTEPAWAEYARRAATESWFMVVPVETARHVSAGLQLGATGDFNHFWFYSLMAAVIGLALELLHIHLQAHATFLVLHATLLSGAFVLALRHHGVTGLVAAVLLTLLSPIVWFVDKVHTEFFTYTAVLSAVVLFLRARYVAAACFLALASTQNISFSAVALVPILVDLVIRRPLRYSFGEMILMLATVALVFVHPLYYFFRYGVIEPQLMIGGARPGLFLSDAWIWFVDPDLGLFPNWPLAIGLLLLAARMKARGGSCAPDRRSWLFFTAVYLLFGLFAASSTIHLNSGGTRSIARYATWYIPLFFPILLMVLEGARTFRGLFPALTLAILVLGGGYNANEYSPVRQEASRVPTAMSAALQKYLPGLYDPPPQVFAGRFSDLFYRWDDTQAFAVVGPDCHKALVRFDVGATGVFGARGCGIDGKRLEPAIRRMVASMGQRSGSGYIRLDDADIQGARYRCPSKVEFGSQGDVPAGALAGFAAPGPNGRWSEGRKASFTCWMDEGPGNLRGHVEIEGSAFVINAQKQRVFITINGGPRQELIFNRRWEKKRTEIDFTPDSSGRFQLDLELPDAESLRRLHISPDPRVLGILIQSIEFKN